METTIFELQNQVPDGLRPEAFKVIINLITKAYYLGQVDAAKKAKEHIEQSARMVQITIDTYSK